MNPIGTMPYFLAAVSSRLRARSRAPSSSNFVWLKRASALRTCASSWIGKRRRPFESTYAKSALRSSARLLALSCGIRLPRRRYGIFPSGGSESAVGGAHQAAVAVGEGDGELVADDAPAL